MKITYKTTKMKWKQYNIYFSVTFKDRLILNLRSCFMNL